MGEFDLYIPEFFLVLEQKVLFDFIKKNSFGILFSQIENKPFATHLPFLLDEGDGTLYGHFARENPQWGNVKGEVLVVFQGPHAYISPSWYEDKNVVPTWNYLAVHVYGEFSIVEEKDLTGILKKSIGFYESSMAKPWDTDLTHEFNQSLMKNIIGFKIKITSIEGKWKLSQNHALERKEKVIKQLLESEDAYGKEIGEKMKS